jgi:hypothetical protein
MEYNAFGQTFYEHLATVLLLLVVVLFLGLCRRPSVRRAAALGTVTGLLALSRASYSYFFVVPATFLYVLGRRPIHPLATRKRLLSVYLLSVALTQGIWCTKNAIVFKTFHA